MRAKYILSVLALVMGQYAIAQLKPTTGAAPQLPLPAVPAAYGTGIKINYVRTWEARKATADTGTAGLADNANYKTATAYMDGLGRPLQTVVKGNSYDGTMDMVGMNIYDAYGREARQYLPYAAAGNGKFRPAAFAEQQQFYHTGYGDQTPFGRADFEASPLSRPVKSYAPGNGWGGANVGTAQAQQFNRMADSVRTATVGNAAGAVPSFGSYYAPGQLYKLVTTDEHGSQTVEYRDKEGKTLLKKVQLADAPSMGHTGWLCTYYVYDMIGRLRTVVPPKATEQFVAGGWILDASVLDELCFSYGYDGNGRMAYKKVPGAAPVYLCYDKRDRPVYMQDGNLRTNSQWMVTFYDALDRPVGTALYATGQTQAQLQVGLDAPQQVGGENPVPVIAEAALTRLTYTYYDEYTLPGAPTYNGSYAATAQANMSTGDEEPDVLAKTDLTRGMATGSQTRVLGGSSFLNTTIYYDTKGRALQTHSGNHRGGTDVNTVVYSFTGKPLSTVQVHGNPASATPGLGTVTVCTRSTYNNDYLLKTEKKINNGNWKRLNQLEYDALGRVKKKWMGDPSANFYVNTDYNIRGWLTGINRADHEALEANGNGTAFYGAVFSEVLCYDHGFTAAQRNGNIAGIKWAAAGDRQARAYGFAYDRANRLTVADFTQRAASAWDVSAGIDYSVANLRYDANGNILGMAQKGFKVGGSAFIDRLRYDYGLTSNKLIGVTDTANDKNSRLGDFKYDAAAKTAQDYTYDVNGNLTADNNKDISNIGYNHLNLPRTITVTGKGSIAYTYDAAGNKLQKTVTDNTVSPAKVTVTDYISGAVYENNLLQFIGHEEGRVRYAKQYYLNGDSAMTWQWDYFYKDHLGNVRSTVTEQRDTARYRATFETANLGKEGALFTNINSTRALIPTAGPNNGDGQGPMDGYPTDNTTLPNQYTSWLDGAGKKLGASITLKVMAGDKVDMGVKYWYKAGWGYPDEPLEPEDVVAGLVNSLSGGAAGLSGGKATAAQLGGSGGPVLPGVTDFLNNQAAYTGSPNAPRAFLNWILLDEQFKYVPGGSSFMQVGAPATVMQAMAQNGLPITKSGYLFVYLSNETEYQNMFFDNLTIQHHTGPLTEETQYYPFGLVQSGISSRSFGRLENKAKFNGIEQNNDFDLNTYEAHYRNLDPQIGRWWGIDPKPNVMLSPYCAMANNPILMSDPLGDTTWVYSRKGKLLETINDNMANQVHFTSKFGRGLAKLSRLFGANTNGYASSMRKNSIAFMGSNTLSDMKSISGHANRINTEIGFVGRISATREIRLTELPLTGNTSDMTKIGAQIDGTYSQDEQKNIFLVGHVHQEKLLAKYGNTYANASDAEKLDLLGTPTNRVSSFAGWDVDYQPLLYRDNVTKDMNGNPIIETAKGQSAALLLTNVGFTVYSTATSSRNNPYVSHPVLEGVTYPSKQSYYLYKRLK